MREVFLQYIDLEFFFHILDNGLIAIHSNSFFRLNNIAFISYK